MWNKGEAYQKCLHTGKQVATNLTICDKKNVKFLVNIRMCCDECVAWWQGPQTAQAYLQNARLCLSQSPSETARIHVHIESWGGACDTMCKNNPNRRQLEMQSPRMCLKFKLVIRFQSLIAWYQISCCHCHRQRDENKNKKREWMLRRL